MIDNTGDGTSGGYDDQLMSFTRYDGVEVRGNRQSVALGTIPVAFTNSCRTAVTDNEFGASAAAPTSTGDCTAPGLAPPRPTPTTRPPGARAATPGGTGGAAARRNARRLRPTTPPATVVVTRSDDPDRAAEIVLAFAAGVAAGAGGVFLFLRTRRNSAAAAAPGREDDRSGPNEGEGR